MLDAPAPTFSPRQTEILDVVEAVFLRDGLRPVRIGQLTDEARCSRSTLYELAPSKEELFLLVLDRLIRRVRRRSLDAIEAAPDPVARLKTAMAASAAGLATISPGFVEAVRAYPPARLLYDQHLQDASANMHDLIEAAIAAGAFRPVDVNVVTQALQAAVDRFIDPEFARATGLDISTALATYFDILVDGLHVAADS